MPLSPDGKPSSEGKIVFISIGMSNTTGEFQRWQALAGPDPARGPKVTIVDCALG